MGIVITIDGGAGTGTSSVARKLSEKLDQPSLNCGHLYRGVTWQCLQEGIQINEVSGLPDLYQAHLLRIACEISFDFKDGSVVAINGQQIEEPELARLSKLVPHIAHYEPVREYIRVIQRDYAASRTCVIAEGRDLGTVVFPDAIRKIFLICEDSERAKRRSNAQGEHVSVAELLKRDRIDRERESSPMKPHRHAMVIDTTRTDVPSVVKMILASMIGVPEAASIIADWI